MEKICPDNVQNLLIRGTNWVGDAVMSIPAMREIRRVFAGARITLLVRTWVRDVYSAVDFVDDVLVYDKTGIHKGWKGVNRLAAELRRERFDAAILMQNAFEAAYISWRARIPIRIGYARDGRGALLTHPCKIDPGISRLHQAYHYLGILSGVRLLDPALWERGDYRLSIKIGVRLEDRHAAQEMLRNLGFAQREVLVGLNPGAFYGGAKRWLTERYAAVGDALAQKHGAKIVVLGAPDERRIADEISAKMKYPPMILAGKTTLGQLMALLNECDLLITNDSGPMHLAAALDVPQLAIFGSTSAVATGPLSATAEVIRNPVDCSPCFLRECPIDFRCMTTISVDQVLAAAEKKILSGERESQL